MAEQLHAASSGCWVIELGQPQMASSIVCMVVHAFLLDDFDNVPRERCWFSIKEGLCDIVAILLSHDDASVRPRPYTEHR